MLDPRPRIRMLGAKRCQNAPPHYLHVRVARKCTGHPELPRWELYIIVVPIIIDEFHICVSI